jgi:hypothetical protein
MLIHARALCAVGAYALARLARCPWPCAGGALCEASNGIDADRLTAPPVACPPRLSGPSVTRSQGQRSFGDLGAKTQIIGAQEQDRRWCSAKWPCWGFDGPATGIPARAKAVILRLGKSWMSDRTKNVLIFLMVVCLAIVVANLPIGISPD